MFQYIFRRLISSLVTIFFIASATFWCMHLVPGDPLISGKGMNEDIKHNLMVKYGLDKPVMEQYFVYLGNLAKGDFGISFTQKNRSVNEIIEQSFPVSATLGVFALVIATIGGICFGSITALFRGKWPDYAIMFLVILGISIPGFVFAAFIQLGMLNLNKMAGFQILPIAGWGSFSQMILPSLVLGLSTMAFMTRIMRSSMLEVVNTDYIRTARAKGVSPSRIFVKHQLRNAVMPVITILGPAIAAITTGGFVTELIFSIPGLGRSFVNSVQQLDYTVIMGTTVFYGAFLVLMVLVVDIIYGFIDPRIRLK